jgi:putative NADH-flavin reductase
MRIAIFGASGATGQLLVERCLAAGYEVTVLARRPESIPQRAVAQVRVVEGNAFDRTALIETLKGADAVLSALGARSLGKEDVLERAVPVIVTAMEACGPARLIVLGSAGALPDSLGKQPAWRRWIVEKIVYKTMLKYPVASQVAQYKALSASRLEWTMVMPPMLTNGKGRGTFRIDGEALPPNGARIARADVADFMMAQLTSARWVKRGVYLSW